MLLEGTELFSYNPGRNREILGFEWVMNSNLCDLALVTNSDVQFLKLNDRKNKLSHVKSYTCQASMYWCHDGVMAIGAQGSETLNFYFLNQNKGPKYFAGPKLTLNLEPHKKGQWAASFSGKIKVSLSPLPHKVMLCRLYEGHFLVHMNCERGECYLYAVCENSAQLHTSIICQELGDYELSCCDNLLFLTNNTAEETYAFDIRSDSYVGVPFCTIVHKPAPVVNKELQLSLLVQQDGSIDFGLGFDLPQTDSMFETIPKDAHVTYSELPELALNFVSQDLCISETACYRLDFNCEKMIESHPDRLEASLFLLRRSGYKVKSYDYIRIAMRERMPLLAFSRFFETVNITYRIALNERKTNRSRAETDEYKIESGMTVLLQSDLHSFVFTPLFEEKSFDSNYLAALLSEYFRSLAEQEVSVHMSLQLLLIKMLIKSKEFVTLHQMVQYHVFSDSRELAQALLVLSSPSNSTHYAAAYQLAIDMLCRLRAPEQVATALLDRNSPIESLNYVSIDTPNCLERVKEEATTFEDLEIREVLKDYIENFRT